MTQMETHCEENERIDGIVAPIIVGMAPVAALAREPCEFAVGTIEQRRDDPQGPGQYGPILAADRECTARSETGRYAQRREVVRSQPRAYERSYQSTGEAADIRIRVA